MTASAEPAPAMRALHGRVPDFFIVGHAKSGTTALYEMLRRHPQIYMPNLKEPQFFARDNPHPQTSTIRSITYTGRRAETMGEYLALFAPASADQRVGEASTGYLWSPTAPARIAKERPDARIIAILREPASFLRSLHSQLVVNVSETETDFRKALELEGARREGRNIPERAYWPSALIYTDRVRYVEQLRRFHAVFARDQVLVLIYDDFLRDNEGTVRRVLRFLDVDDTVPVEVIEANPSFTLRSTLVNDLRVSLRAGRGPVLGAIKAAGRALTPKRFRYSVLYPLQHRVVYGQPAPPDEQLMGELRHRFKPEVEALSEYLDRDLVALWGYGNLG